MAPKKWMAANYGRMFGAKPNSRVKSPLEQNDHPELDESALLDEDGTRKHQSLMGTLQWAISLTPFDITAVVMSMSQRVPLNTVCLGFLMGRFPPALPRRQVWSGGVWWHFCRLLVKGTPDALFLSHGGGTVTLNYFGFRS